MKYLSRFQVRNYIRQGIEMGLTIRQIIDSIRIKNKRNEELVTGRYGW